MFLSIILPCGISSTVKGLTALGQRIANMTIGELEAMLDLQNLDPIAILQLMKDLRALYRTFVSANLGPQARHAQSESRIALWDLEVPKEGCPNGPGCRWPMWPLKMALAASVEGPCDLCGWPMWSV